MRERKAYLIIFFCMILFSCSVVSNIRIQGDINTDKKLLVEYRKKIVLLRSQIIRDDTITIERITDFYDPAIKGLVIEYNILAEEGKTLRAEDKDMWEDWRLRVMELGNDVKKLERIYKAEVHGARLETYYRFMEKAV
jgi:hypothetical protein